MHKFVANSSKLKIWCCDMLKYPSQPTKKSFLQTGKDRTEWKSSDPKDCLTQLDGCPCLAYEIPKISRCTINKNNIVFPI